MTRKSLTRGHVAFDTSGFFRKIAVCLDSPYLQQIAFKRKMPTNAIACRTSIPRFKSGTGSLHALLNFVQNRIFEKKRYQVRLARGSGETNVYYSVKAELTAN